MTPSPASRPLPKDLAVTMSRHDARPVLHRVDCPEVRAESAAGRPVLTMLDCAGRDELEGMERHGCLDA